MFWKHTIFLFFLISVVQCQGEQPSVVIPDSTLKVIEAAESRIGKTLYYDPAYVGLDYPNGDVPEDRGVCTDVVIRAFRKVGVDLQQLIHEDMKKNFESYPKKWGLKKPDKNIDHRRVPNMVHYFNRHKISLPVSDSAKHYLPGDLITWVLPGDLDHIGLVSSRKVPGTKRHFIIHNIGSGTEYEDIMFTYKITGHFRYFPLPDQ